MASNPHVVQLLEEMLDSGGPRGGVPRMPELLEEVGHAGGLLPHRRRRRAYFPEPATPPDAGAGSAPATPACRRSPVTRCRRCSAAGGWASSTGPTPGPEAHRRREDARGGHADQADRARFERRPRPSPGCSTKRLQIHEVAITTGGVLSALDSSRAARWRSDWPGRPLPAARRRPAGCGAGRGDAPGPQPQPRPPRPEPATCCSPGATRRARSNQCQPKVSDFGPGPANWTPTPTDARRVVMGTPATLAPSRPRAAPQRRPAADTYALGAILYEC